MARLPTNREIEQVSEQMIEILKSREDLIKSFTNSLIEDANKHTLSGLLLDC